MSISKFLPMLTASFFAPSQPEAVAKPAQCKLTRIITLNEKYEGVSTMRTPLLTFSRDHIDGIDMNSEIKIAILNDLEDLNDQFARELDIIHGQARGRIESEDIQITSPYLIPDTQVHTAYVLLMDDGRIHELYKKSGNLDHMGSEQIEIQIHRALAPADFPKVREKGFGF